MIIKLLEFAAIALCLILFISQIIWPIMRGRPMFPLFKPQTKIEKEHSDLEQALYEQKLMEDNVNLRKEFVAHQPAALVPIAEPANTEVKLEESK